ncbi:AbfB domain-containing protein [Deinococcus radiotolerans]|uniref:Alpha-L-arabinofuranosidase B arabinose-binding domain-containing protein n=1 Tax=Deinococcus radiotolerans TaxID=1309407 RepID=A0ABQ2FQP5_9DEIO|nr:AbfB domain-containing protein [Deinococcus radiotolerans]GGL17601.1 hypothetical protein GCM10010844_40530 [Deinococcus radiotolerans]
MPILSPLALRSALLLAALVSTSNAAAVAVNQRVSLRAVTPAVSNNYIAHENFIGVIRPVSSTSTATRKADATWVLRTGLADSNCYSFESVNYPGYFLRHTNFKLYLWKNDATQAFNNDATFCLTPPLIGNVGVGLVPVNYLNYNVRHYSSNLLLNTEQNNYTFRVDATFDFVAPWAP